MTHLEYLEAESIHIMREVVAEAEMKAFQRGAFSIEG
jgi:hypothetical protein